MHLITLHDSAGSGNPLGVSGNYDRLPFAPYFVFKDLVTIFLFIIVLSIFVFFMPNMLGDSENYVMANPMQTPPAIVPEWYLLPFYAILRSIPNKLLGVIAMLTAILALLTMPFTDLSKFRGLQFRPLSKIVFFIFIANFLILMQLGAKHVESPFIEFGQLSTLLYFSHFLFIVPFVSLLENTLIDLNLNDKKLKTVNYFGLINKPNFHNIIESKFYGGPLYLLLIFYPSESIKCISFSIFPFSMLYNIGLDIETFLHYFTDEGFLFMGGCPLEGDNGEILFMEGNLSAGSSLPINSPQDVEPSGYNTVNNTGNPIINRIDNSIRILSTGPEEVENKSGDPSQNPNSVEILFRLKRICIGAWYAINKDILEFSENDPATRRLAHEAYHSASYQELLRINGEIA